MKYFLWLNQFVFSTFHCNDCTLMCSFSYSQLHFFLAFFSILILKNIYTLFTIYMKELKMIIVNFNLLCVSKQNMYAIFFFHYHFCLCFKTHFAIRTKANHTCHFILTSTLRWAWPKIKTSYYSLSFAVVHDQWGWWNSFTFAAT